MIIAQEFVTDNGISIIGAAFFTGLFALLGIVAKGVFDNKKLSIDARDEAQKASENTKNVSNGFASGVDRNLKAINESVLQTHDAVDKLQESFQKHLEWHLSKGDK